MTRTHASGHRGRARIEPAGQRPPPDVQRSRSRRLAYRDDELLDRFATREEVGREFAAAGAPHELCSARERSRAGPLTRSVLPQRRRREAAYPRPSATRYALRSLLAL